MKIKDNNIKELINIWRPSLGNKDDLEILKIISSKDSSKKDDYSIKLKNKTLLDLLKKRISEGAVRKLKN